MLLTGQVEATSPGLSSACSARVESRTSAKPLRAKFLALKTLYYLTLRRPSSRTAKREYPAREHLVVRVSILQVRPGPRPPIMTRL